MANAFGRRQVLKFAAGSAVAALLAACGSGPATTAPTKPAGTPLAGGTGGQTPAPVATTLVGGTGGQTPAPAAASAPSGTAARSAASSVAGAPASALSATSTPNPAIKGSVRYWQQTFDDPTIPDAKYHDEFLNFIKTAYPNITLTEEQIAYADTLDKIRTAIRAGQAPDMAEIQLTWAPELAATGALLELNLADFGYTPDKFWPGALPATGAGVCPPVPPTRVVATGAGVCPPVPPGSGVPAGFVGAVVAGPLPHAARSAATAEPAANFRT